MRVLNLVLEGFSMKKFDMIVFVEKDALWISWKLNIASLDMFVVGVP